MLLRQPFCYDSSTQPLPVFLFFLTQGNACLRRTIHTFFPDKVCSKMLLSLESHHLKICRRSAVHRVTIGSSVQFIYTFHCFLCWSVIRFAGCFGKEQQEISKTIDRIICT